MMTYNSSCTPLKVRPILDQKERKDIMNTSSYRSLIGSLRYLTHTMPNLMFNVRFLNRFMENPSSEHFKSVKWVLRYIKGTFDLGLKYKKEKNFVLEGLYDSDDRVDAEERKSTFSFYFFVGENLVTWVSQK